MEPLANVGPSRESAPSIYVGVPGTGKTTGALEQAAADVRETGWPILLIDSQDNCHPPGDGEYAGFTFAPSVRDAIQLIWGSGQSARFVPGQDGLNEVDQLAAAIRECGHVVLVIDEIAFWATAHRTPPRFEMLLRVWRHVGVRIHMTTQYPGDVAPIVLTCAGRVFCFRCDTLPALKRLQLQYNLDPDKIRNLPKFAFDIWERW